MTLTNEEIMLAEILGRNYFPRFTTDDEKMAGKQIKKSPAEVFG